MRRVDIPVRSDDPRDACPLCDSPLGRPRGGTRRQIVFTAERGVFRWRCPDCRGIWQVQRVTRAPTAEGVRLRSAPHPS